MKSKFIFPSAIVLFVLFMTQAADTRLGVKDKAAHEHMFISADGPKEWYSALELERVARDFAVSNKADFRFEGTEMNIWVKTDGGKVLADVFWSSAVGKPGLHVEIGRDGKAIRCQVNPTGG